MSVLFCVWPGMFSMMAVLQLMLRLLHFFVHHCLIHRVWDWVEALSSPSWTRMVLLLIHHWWINFYYGCLRNTIKYVTQQLSNINQLKRKHTQQSSTNLKNKPAPQSTTLKILSAIPKINQPKNYQPIKLLLNSTVSSISFLCVSS